jgi:hypothetical protein
MNFILGVLLGAIFISLNPELGEVVLTLVNDIVNVFTDIEIN